jgi:uncharacterized damage-inducible protein DinB
MTERQDILDYLDQTGERLLIRARSLLPEQMSLFAKAGGWTIAGILEHIVFVEQRALNAVRKAVREPADASLKSARAGQDELLVRQVASRGTRVSASPLAQPQGGLPLEMLIERFVAAREDTRAFASSVEADLRKHFARHPAFGPLDCHQWLLFIGAHGERHRAQMEEILADASAVATLRNS